MPFIAHHRVLLLDFGGVCIPHPFEMPQLLADTLGVPVEVVTWAGPSDPAADPLWQRQQAGELTERQYWAVRAAEVGRAVDGTDWSLPQFMQRFHETVDGNRLIRPEAVAMVDAAEAAGVQVAVLTNDLRYFAGDRFIEENTFLARCRPIVDASVNGVLKPDPGAYALALEALGNPSPGDVLFVDDQPANAAGGRTAGLAVVHFDITDPHRSWWRVAEALFDADAADALFGRPR